MRSACVALKKPRQWQRMRFTNALGMRSLICCLFPGTKVMCRLAGSLPACVGRLLRRDGKDAFRQGIN